MKKVCAFFGHRELSRDISMQLDAAIYTAIHEYGISSFWCGRYGAFDLAAAHAMQRTKQQHPHIELVWVRAYIPAAHAPDASLFDDSFYPEGLENTPRRFAIVKRNKWIADHCNLIIAYVDSRYGGAYTACRRYARTGKHMINPGVLDNI